MNIAELNEMLQEGLFAKVVNELQKGRKDQAPDIEEIESEFDYRLHKVNDPRYRPNKRVKVDKKKSANMIDRFVGGNEQVQYKEVPVARIPISLQNVIVNRAVAFCFGSQVIYNAEPKDGTAESDVLKSLQLVLTAIKSKTVNRRVAKALFTYTEAAELWYLCEGNNNDYGFESAGKLRCQVLTPGKNMHLYPYFNDEGDMIAFSRQYTLTNADNLSLSYFETWTDEMHYRWLLTGNNGWSLDEGFPTPNKLGKIPVVYCSQENTEWFVVQPLIERLETILSNFADTNDYHSSPKLLVTGNIQGFAEKGESGSVLKMGEGSKVEYLTWSQAPESIKLEVEMLLRNIYTLTQTPDISFENMKGLGQISGTALRTLFMDAHLKVMDKAEIFDEYLQRRCNLIKAFLKLLNKNTDFSNACDTLVVEPEITPYMIDDDSSKINMLLAANGQKSLISRKTAMQILNWSNNIEQEMQEIEKEESGNLMADMFEPTE